MQIVNLFVRIISLPINVSLLQTDRHSQFFFCCRVNFSAWEKWREAMRRRTFYPILFLIAAAVSGAIFLRLNTGQPAPAQPGNPATDLPDLGKAPELHDGVWINTDGPIRLADLKGKVVLLEMWTYGCYNCRNVLPSLKHWHNLYAGQGFVIIGNHFPEFAHERELENLKTAVQELEVPYPVLQDNEGITWRAYNNRYWPTLYLIDKRGHIRYRRIGEGDYERTETAIRALLDETIP